MSQYRSAPLKLQVCALPGSSLLGRVCLCACICLSLAVLMSTVVCLCWFFGAGCGFLFLGIWQADLSHHDLEASCAGNGGRG